MKSYCFRLYDPIALLSRRLQKIRNLTDKVPSAIIVCSAEKIKKFFGASATITYLFGRGSWARTQRGKRDQQPTTIVRYTYMRKVCSENI